MVLQESLSYAENADQVFLYKYDLERHKLTRSGKKPHECKICDKRFSDRTAMNKHTGTHNKKSLKCALCGKNFKFESRLNKHKCAGVDKSMVQVLELWCVFYISKSLGIAYKTGPCRVAGKKRTSKINKCKNNGVLSKTLPGKQGADGNTVVNQSHSMVDQPSAISHQQAVLVRWHCHRISTHSDTADMNSGQERGGIPDRSGWWFRVSAWDARIHSFSVRRRSWYRCLL